MRWIKPNLKSSLHALLGSAPPSDSTLESRTEEIRQAMLEALGDNGHKLYPLITRKVRYSDGIESLWYLRGDTDGSPVCHARRTAGASRSQA